MKPRIFLLFGVLLATPPPASSAFAQGEAGGVVHGTVRDGSGALVPGASVTLLHLQTRLSQTVVTSDAGAFSFPRVAVGTYEVSVEFPGFKKLVRTGFTVRVNDVIDFDLVMVIGEPAEEIIVTAEAPMIQKETTHLGGVVDSNRVANLPLNGRDFQQLILLQPGVLQGNPGGSGQGSGQFVSGSRATNNNFLVDGGSQNDPQVPFGQAGSFAGATGPGGISADAVQEFRVITSNADAEFGRSSGAQVNVITKSGGNQFHGSVIAFHRNDDLDARDFFDPEDKSEFKQNNFGFSLGGPIIKDRHFFFGNYEGFRMRRADNTRVGVPNADLIRLIPGQLGQLFKATYLDTGLIPASGNPAQIFSFQPLSNAVLADLQAQGRQITGNPGVVSQILPFPDNTDQDQFLIRTDHQLWDTDRVAVRYNFSEGDTPGGALGGAVPGFRFGFSARQQALTITEDHTFSPRLVNTFRFNFNRNKLAFPLEATPQPLLGLGFGEGDAPNGPPTVTLTGTGISSFGQPNNMPQSRVSNEYQWNDTANWVRGDHRLRFGGDLRRIQTNSDFSALLRPLIAFSGFTGANGILGPRGTNAEPVVLQARQNLFGGFGQGPNSGLRGFRLTELGFFFQDDWKFRDNITLNLGVRYEYLTPLTETNDVLSNLFDTSSGTPNDDLGVGVGNVLAGKVGIGVVDGNLDFTDPDRNNWAPRVGITWDPFRNGKTVVSSSYGIFYDRTFGNVVGNARFAPPFVADALRVNVPFSLGLAPSVQDALTPGVTAINPKARTPYTQRWNVTVQHELSSTMVVTGSYVGSKGSNLIRTTLPNLGASGIPTAARPNPNFTTITLRETSASSIYHALEAGFQRRFAEGLVIQAAYTFSKSIDDVSGEIVAGIDSAVPQATITNLGAPSTIGPFGPGNLALDRGLSVFDARNRLVVNYIYELPVGPGKRWFNGGGWVGKLTGGWSITGITTLQSGSPFTPVTGIDNNRDGTFNDRVGSLGTGDPKTALADDSSVVRSGSVNNGVPTFLLPNGNGVIGDPLDPVNIGARLGRGFFHGPGLAVFDFGARKVTPVNYLGEQANVEFRAEFFNIFNHTNFSAPNINLRSPFFGQILATRTSPREIQFGLKLNF